MCLVDVERAPKPVASCAMPAMPGSNVFTNSERTNKAREGVMEFLLANHPLDCPICDQGGECDLQDQSMRYGSDRSRFFEVTGKRAVENKDFGPLVKTSMNRCIQCTRCVRFANEVAGVEELGTTGRGNDLEIGTYVHKTLDSELSGNIVDLCPVGALTSKPYAFTARPWELKNTESVDALDAVGSNIRVDSRGHEVMRIQPRVNDDVNEEWISDRTRYAYDGLKYQRLTNPLIRVGDRFQSASWPDALATVADGLVKSGAKGDEIKAIAGSLADTESLVALKDLLNKLGSENTSLETKRGDSPPAHGIDHRSNYLYNVTIPGSEEADAVLFVGTNPRHEAAVINSRFRKAFLHNNTDFGLVGEKFDSIYEIEHIGVDVKSLKNFLEGNVKSTFSESFKNAKKPLIVVGSAVTEHPDAENVYGTIAKYVEGNKDRFVNDEWNGFSTLQRAASRTAAYDVGFVPSADAKNSKPKFVYLLNADDFEPEAIPRDAFVVYQGHHGDVGAQYADVVLPGVAYTEKGTTWINTEGRAQLGRAAISSPGASREDWKIIKALSELMGKPLPYEDVIAIRDRLWEISPSLTRYDELESPSPISVGLGIAQLASRGSSLQEKNEPFIKIIENFYQTDPISRASVTMANCVKAFHKGDTNEETAVPLNA